MAMNREEQLSSFFDGELDNKQCDHVVNTLCNDPLFQRHWDRFSLISDAMKNTLPPILRKDFSSTVMQAIENEPTVLSPQSRHSKSTAISPFTKRLTSFAIAASVATIAVIGVYMQHSEVQDAQQLVSMPSQDEFVRLPQQPRVASAEALPPLNVFSASSALTLPDRTSPKITAASAQNTTQAPPLLINDPQFNDHIHKYLMNHNQNVSGTRIQGLIPYARIIATPAESSLQAQQ